ncbi:MULTISPECIES: hypothetical protein [Citrobacter]|jgi:hypothetical protein|uniref:hypothetical protein n=1 Tax=Citrobacter TaxID=544 RepID=UPI0006665BFD|nr:MULTISPECIES: hypothetical protein [Citrobacter]MCZ5392778.1 hypothetical protein [Citrobacter braakii]MDM3322308.1 hypothetical protein [Citrobacter sp. Cb080]MDM3418199.1 hypothetical protein [Citrobacter sp. Cb021]
MKRVAMCILGVLFLSGCSQRVADLTVASTKNYNMNGGQFVTGNRVTGEDSSAIVIFPLGMPNVKEAADRAIEQNRCAVGLTNVVVEQYVYAFLFGVQGFTVEGNLVLDKTLPGCFNAK